MTVPLHSNALPEEADAPDEASRVAAEAKELQELAFRAFLCPPAARFPRRTGVFSPVVRNAVDDVDAALAAVAGCKNFLVFSGAGLSASAGMSAFSSPDGLYERARRRFGLDKGVRLFYASFFDKRRRDAQAFLADVYCEATAAAPTRAHTALAHLAAGGRLRRHVTMNVDGLHRAGAALWSPTQPEGVTMELHGSCLEVVCESCGACSAMSHALARAFRAEEPAAEQPCCAFEDCAGLLRPKIMLYDDPDEDLITPEEYEDTLAEDVACADAILWVGISFEQSASVEHFRRARRALQAAGRACVVPQVVVNPDAEALFNVTTAVANADELRLLPARTTADEFLGALAGLPPLPAKGAAAAEAVRGGAPQPPVATTGRRGPRRRRRIDDDGGG